MTTQQTDIEKTLKRILARGLPTWRKNADSAVQDADGEVKFMKGVQASLSYSSTVWERLDPVPGCCIYLDAADDRTESIVTRAQWEAERALLASEQAQPLGDSEEFDQALWDKVASEIFTRACDESIASYRPEEVEYVAVRACTYADAFMDERAKRIAARKASHD